MKNPDDICLAHLRERFPDHDIKPESLTLLNKGRFANAYVYRYHDEKLDLIIKDFSHCPWIVRVTAGRLFVRREGKILDRLAGIPGVAAQRFGLSPVALAYPFIHGKTLASVRKADLTLPPSFFQNLEQLVSRMHQRGVAHLDMRNLSNVLVGADGMPYLIDFQSAIDLHGLPLMLQRLLEQVDLSGIYKCWMRVCSEPLDAARQEFLDRFNRLRKVWVFKGYVFTRWMERVRGI